MRIAIPSYNRPKTIKKATLNTIRNIDKSIIDIFVADDEQYKLYLETLGNDYNIIIGEKGMKNIRNFMINYYNEGDEIFYLDDDIYDFYKLDNEKLIIMDDILHFIYKGFDVLKKSGAELFGIYPVKNGFFMNNETTTHLTYIVGCTYGCINRKSIQLTIDDKEDYERSILYYLNNQKVIRFNYITIKTKYYTEKGGLQSDGMRHWDQVDKSARYLVDKYPDLCKINISKKKVDKITKKVLTEIKFLSKKKVFIDDLSNIQNLVLNELQNLKWYKNTTRSNVSGLDIEKSIKYDETKKITTNMRVGNPCSSITLGYIRRRWHKKGNNTLTIRTCKYNHLYDLLQEYVKFLKPDFEYTTITVNKNLKCLPHIDKNNENISLAIGLGDYTGGNLIIKNVIHDIRYKPLLFSGKDEHWNDDFVGDRYSLIFYTI